MSSYMMTPTSDDIVFKAIAHPLLSYPVESAKRPIAFLKNAFRTLSIVITRSLRNRYQVFPIYLNYNHALFILQRT